MTTSTAVRPPTASEPKPIVVPGRSMMDQFLVRAFVLIPFAALIAAVPLAWGWGLGWVDVGLAAGCYVVSCLGVTVGYHRYFTHRAFRARRGLRIALAVAGGLAAQGPVIGWVADHRRHHAFSDREGDPHSPWLFGTGPVALAKGFCHAHMGWLFERVSTNTERFAPDLLADRDIRIVDRLFPLWVVLTVAIPTALGGLITWSWWGAATAFFWAGLVRVSFLHHVTWSINSICHMIGDRPFASRDKAANFWPLAILSMGESWHNSHHADPTCARHGVLRGQLDISARVIWLFERIGWATDVRWTNPARLARLAATRHPERGDDTVIALLRSVPNDPPRPRAPRHAGSEHLVVTVRRIPPGAVVLVVRGSVDLLSSPLLRDRLLPHVRPPVPCVIVDLTEVDFLSAAGLTVLIEVRAAAVAAGIGLSLVAHTRVVLLPLTITGLDREFDIHADLADALAIPSPLRS